MRFCIVKELALVAAVPDPIASALKPLFVNIIAPWKIEGSSPSDQNGSSQYPLVGLVQLLVGADGALVGLIKAKIARRNADHLPTFIATSVRNWARWGNGAKPACRE